MTDNVTLPGTGQVIATDDIAGVQYQIVKMAYGALDSVNLVTSQPSTETTLASVLSKMSSGLSAPSASMPVALPNANMVSGGSLSSPVINTELLTNTVSGWLDVSGYKSVTIQIQTGAGISAGVLTFEQTNDTTASSAGNVFLVQDATVLTSNPQTTYTLTASATKTYAAPVLSRYIRVRVSTAVTGGTVQATACLSQTPYANNYVVAIQSTGASLQAQLAAGTNLSNDVGIQLRANATGAATIGRVMSAASTNATSVKASAGRVVGFYLYNTTASAKFFKFYNKASSPTVGTDTPVFTIGIPANGVADDACVAGMAFSTGIAYAITGAVGDADTTATAVNDVVGAIYYA